MTCIIMFDFCSFGIQNFNLHHCIEKKGGHTCAWVEATVTCVAWVTQVSGDGGETENVSFCVENHEG